MRHHQGDRRGFALALALVAIVVIGAIIGGVFFASTQEYRIGRNTLMQTRALTSAEYGLHYIMRPGIWNPDWSTTQPVGGNPIIVPFSLDGGLSVDTLRMTRLNTNSYLVVSEGKAGGAAMLARRRIGAAVVITPLQINILGALTTRGSTRIGGSSYIDGTDHTEPGWGCPAPEAALPGIAIPDPDLMIVTSGCPNLNCVEGDPKILPSAEAAEDSTYFKYGEVEWADLVAMATKRIAAGVTLNGIGPTLDTDGSCKKSDLLNWGDPLRLTTCGNYFPIIYAEGNLKILTGMGQGILLVEGDLDVQGGFQFYGPVIVRGKLVTQGTGGHFIGGVLASNVDLDQNTALGNAVINYSSCVLAQATLAAAVPKFANGNAWIEMY